jgi:hypothetical protein
MGIYTNATSTASFSGSEGVFSSEGFRLEQPREQRTGGASLITGLSSCQIPSILSQEGAKGGSAKEQAFQLALTGTPSC